MFTFGRTTASISVEPTIIGGEPFPYMVAVVGWEQTSKGIYRVWGVVADDQGNTLERPSFTIWRTDGLDDQYRPARWAVDDEDGYRFFANGFQTRRDATEAILKHSLVAARLKIVAARFANA